MITFDPATTKKPNYIEAFDMIGALPPEVKQGVRHLLLRIWRHTSNNPSHKYFGTAWESIKRLAVEMGYTDIADLFAEAEKLGLVGRVHHFQTPGEVIVESGNYQEGLKQGLGEYVGSRYWVIWAKVKELAQEGIGKIPTPPPDDGIGKFPTPKESTTSAPSGKLASGKLASENSRPRVYTKPASEHPENPRSDPAAVSNTDAGARTQPDAADGDKHNTASLSAVLPKETAEIKPSIHPDQPTGRTEGRKEFSGEEQHSNIEFEIEAVTAETPGQIQRQSRKEYAIEKSDEYRKLPKATRAQLDNLVEHCRVAWTESIASDEDLSVFPAPKRYHKVKLAELLQAHGESQVLERWTRFLDRPQGFAYLKDVWANFFHEFKYYVPADEESA
jgi:hypothetical protein